MKRWLVASLLMAGCAGSGPQATSLIADLGTNRAVPAFSELDQSQDPAVFNALLDGTKSDQPRVRAHCARLLGRKRDVTAIASLRGLLSDSDRTARVQAARSLVVLADPAQVLDWLQEPKTPPPAREALAMALVEEQVDEVLPLLRTWLADPQESLTLRLIACTGLQQAGPRAQAGPLLLAQARTTSNDLELRARALEAYGAVIGPPAVPELASWLQRPPQRTQEGALRGLGHVHDAAALALLAGVAQDRTLSRSSRVAAVNGISQSKASPEARRLVLQALQDPDAYVRKAAACSLRCFAGQPGVKEALLEARRAETNEAVEKELDCALQAGECRPCK